MVSDAEANPLAAQDERNALVVVGHPVPTSFNHALAGAATRALRGCGLNVQLHDLYAENFDPLLPAGEAGSMATAAVSVDPLVREHQRLLAAADVLVMIHPNWWGKPPAIVAGWIDRVLAPGVAYRLNTREGIPEPLLGLRQLVVLNTSDTPAERESSVFGDPLQLIWQRCVGEYIPHAVFIRRTFAPIGSSSPEERAGWLDEIPSLILPLPAKTPR